MTRFSWSSASATGATSSANEVCGAATAGMITVVAGVEEVLHHHHRVVPLLERLPVEVRGELRQRLAVVVNGDRDVLLRGRELVRDLLVEFLLKGGHGLESIARPG